MKRVNLIQLNDIYMTTDLDVLVFMGYTVRKETDIEGEPRSFLKDEEKYYKLTSIHGSNMYVRQGKLTEMLLSEAESKAVSKVICAHGYPESKLIPSDHGEKREDAFIEHYLEEFSKILRYNLVELL